MDKIFKLSEEDKTPIEVLDKNVEHITILDGVEVIGKWAFSYCSSRQSIHIHNTNLEKLNIVENAFYNVNMDECILYIPAGARWEYRHHPVFGKFKNIEIEC